MPGRRHVAATAALFAVTLLLTACGERSEPTGPTSDLFPVTVTAGDDREVTLSAPATRVAVLDPALAQLVSSFAVRTREPVDPDGSVRTRDLRRFRPDLVVASPAVGERQLTRADAAGGGAPVYVAPVSSLREVERAITQLGMLTAQPTAARRVVANIERKRSAVARRVGALPPVSAFVDLGSFTTATDQTLTGDLLRIAGGKNVAAGAIDGGPFDLGELRRANPEVYVTTNDTGITLRSLRSDRKTKQLAAVRDGRVVVVDAHDLDPGPSIGRALERLAAALHPNASR